MKKSPMSYLAPERAFEVQTTERQFRANADLAEGVAGQLEFCSTQDAKQACCESVVVPRRSNIRSR